MILKSQDLSYNIPTSFKNESITFFLDETNDISIVFKNENFYKLLNYMDIEKIIVNRLQESNQYEKNNLTYRKLLSKYGVLENNYPKIYLFFKENIDMYCLKKTDEELDMFKNVLSYYDDNQIEDIIYFVNEFSNIVRQEIKKKLPEKIKPINDYEFLKDSIVVNKNYNLVLNKDVCKEIKKEITELCNKEKEHVMNYYGLQKKLNNEYVNVLNELDNFEIIDYNDLHENKIEQLFNIICDVKKLFNL